LTVDCDKKVFKKITNEDIYQKVCDLEKHVIATNGKVKLNHWLATTALSLVLVLFGVIGFKMVI